MSSNYFLWKPARFRKGHSPNKTEPEDSDLIWPDNTKDEDEEEDDLDPSIDLVDLMEGSNDPKPCRPRGGYRAHTWRDEWIRRNDE